MRSHLISQVVLRQFANADSQVMVHNLKTGRSELKDIYDTAYREVDSRLIEELELHWSSSTEDPAKRAINTLASANVLLVEKHIDVIKKLLSLHYMRAGIFLLVDDSAWMDKFYPESIDQILEHYPDLKPKVAAMWQETKLKAAIEAITVNVTKAETLMGKYGFEIGQAPEGSEFILGDLPTLITDGEGNFGPQNGVPLTEARGFAMPLTPKHIVALKKDPTSKKYRVLTDKEVQNVNNKILQQTTNEYYTTATYKS